MELETDGARVTVLVASGVAEEEAVRDRFFLKSASRTGSLAERNQSYTILFSSKIGENKQN